MNYEGRLIKAVHKASNPVVLSTKADLVDYYQQRQERGEVASWRQAIQSDLVALTGKKSSAIARRFDPSRLDRRAGTQTAKEYAALGKQIGTVGYRPPPGGYHIEWALGFTISETTNNVRSAKQKLTGPDAYAFAQNPNWQTLVGLYADGKVDIAEIDHIYDLEVTPLW